MEAKPYCHKLGQSDVIFLAHPDLAEKHAALFPSSLERMPLLLPGEDSALRSGIDRWIKKKNLRIHIAGVFDDIALMAAFGREMIGAFPAPAALVDEFTADGAFVALGRAEGVSVDYFALSFERKTKHPCVTAITTAAKECFGATGEAASPGR